MEIYREGVRDLWSDTPLEAAGEIVDMNSIRNGYENELPFSYRIKIHKTSNGSGTCL